MKRGSTFHVLVFLMASLIFAMPFTTLAQQQQSTVEAEAKAQAIADAKKDTSKSSWFMVGFFLNIIGVTIAQTSMAPVPADRLIGKSPEYAIAYTLSYQTERTRIQARSALMGCGLLAGLCILGIIKEAIDGGGGGWCSPFL